MDLIKQALIDKLHTKRLLLIDMISQQIRITKRSYAVCKEMDDLIPAHTLANYDYLDIIFIEFKSSFGETSNSRLPKDVNLLSRSDDDCIAQFVKILDGNLWRILFNRLNILSLMSQQAKQKFYAQIKSSPLIFSPINVENTLRDILNKQDEYLLNGLIESILSADNRYQCNNQFKFTSKIIFTGSCLKRHDHFKLNESGCFKDTITFLSKVIFGQKSISSSKGGIIESTYLWGLLTDFFTQKKIARIENDEIDFTGGKIRFYNNGNAHLYLDKEIVNYLNASLGKSKSINCPKD